jgi:hypothetical protein
MIYVDISLKENSHEFQKPSRNPKHCEYHSSQFCGSGTFIFVDEQHCNQEKCKLANSMYSRFDDN